MEIQNFVWILITCFSGVVVPDQTRPGLPSDKNYFSEFLYNNCLSAGDLTNVVLTVVLDYTIALLEGSNCLLAQIREEQIQQCITIDLVILKTLFRFVAQLWP